MQAAGGSGRGARPDDGASGGARDDGGLGQRARPDGDTGEGAHRSDVGDPGGDGALLSRRSRRLLVGGCVLVLFALVAYAGVLAARSSRTPPPVAQGQVRLGPEPGEPVAAYLARVPATLPAPGERAYALVQLGPELTPDAAAALVDGAGAAGGSALAVGEAVLRVPIPRVQTALRFLILPAGAPLRGALDSARQQAGHAAEADATRLTGRPAAVARAEAAAYAATTPAASPVTPPPPSAAPTTPLAAAPTAVPTAPPASAVAPSPCACVLALVVQADRAGLAALAATPGVRAVEAAPPGVPLSGLALSPLLPEQTVTADPVPDDAPAP